MVTTALTVVTSSPCSNISGRQLAHNHYDLVGRAFLAADLFSGAKQLVAPTMVQTAALARVSPAYAWAAYRRLGERDAIEQGFIPLVPPRIVASKKNGTALVPTVDMTDAQLLELVRILGTGRVLEAACAVEASQ